MRKWIVAAFIIAALAGCKSTETQTPAPVEDGAPTATAPATGGATTSGVGTPGVSGTPGGGAAAALRDPNNILSKRNIYFDFD
jgi:peptidoglycan-associated lipoprotein